MVNKLLLTIASLLQEKKKVFLLAPHSQSTLSAILKDERPQRVEVRAEGTEEAAF